MAAVSVRWLTSDPDRGRHEDGTGVDFKVFDGLIVEEFHAVATFDQCDAFGCEAFKFD